MRSNIKGDITINVIMVLLITIVSILLLLGIFSAKLPTFAKSIYCKTFFFIHSSSFIPQAIRQDQTYCSQGLFLDKRILTNETPLNVTLLGFMSACWEKSDFGKSTENIRCYELTVGPRVDTPTVSEAEITEILIDSGVCDVFSNNDVDPDCGTSDDINWQLLDDETPEEKNILVEYQDGQIVIS